MQILILTCTYTANLASAITTSALTLVSLTNITSLSDLKGTHVLAQSLYLEELYENHGIKAAPLDLDGDDVFTSVSKLLESKSITAYVCDIIVLQSYLQSSLACSYSFVGGLINPFNYAFAFSPSFEEPLLTQFNAGLMVVQVCKTSCYINEVYNGC